MSVSLGVRVNRVRLAIGPQPHRPFVWQGPLRVFRCVKLASPLELGSQLGLWIHGVWFCRWCALAAVAVRSCMVRERTHVEFCQSLGHVWQGGLCPHGGLCQWVIRWGR